MTPFYQDPMTELSICSGAGGGLLATQHLLGFKTVCYVEIGKYPQAVLRARIADGLLDDAPIWDDVKTFAGTAWRGKVDIITAGFPCQGYSVAGKKRGKDDDRNIWPDIIRTICEVRPEWVLLENVPGLLTFAYFGTILGDLAQAGYDAVWECISAAQVGAPHKRERLWIVAHTTRQPCSRGHPSRGNKEQIQLRRHFGSTGGYWDVEPDVDRVANGVAFGMDRLKALGEGQVPAVVREAWLRLSRALLEAETQGML